MNVPVALRRLWIQITADRRRFGLLCAVVGVGLLLWARLIVITNTPRTVVAGDKSHQLAQNDQPTDPSQPAQAETPPTTDAPKTPVRIVLATSPQRDPFVISDEHFPRPTSADTDAQDPAKFTSEPAEDSQHAQLARIQSMVEQLKLEAILSPGSGEPLVVINAKTYQLNDEIPLPGQAGSQSPTKLRLVHVAERSVTLAFGDHLFQRRLRTVTIDN